MLFPFLPFILALAGLTALVAMPEPPPAQMELWQVAVSFAALPLIGFLLGHLPDSAVSRSSALRLSARRVMLLALWLVVVSGLNLYHEILPRLADWPAADELALTLLLANFWLSDALALRPFRPREPDAWPALRGALAVSLPALVLFLIGVAASFAFGRLLAAEAVGAWQWPMLLLGYALMMGLAVPLVIRVCWRFRPLESKAAEQAILEELAANGIRGTRVYAWPEGALGATTAAVIGLVRPFRYMLIGPSLAGALTTGELRAVTAHEAAHVRLRHLWYYFAAIFGFILFMQIAMVGVLIASFVLGGGFPVWLGGAIEILALLLFLRFGIGLLSRHFERQADIHAFRRHGLAPLATALVKVGALNQIPPGLDNWHHYGIARRIAYLEQAGGDSPSAAATGAGVLAAHDRRVNRLKFGVLCFLALLVVAQPFLAAAGRLPGFAKTFLAARLEQVETPSESEFYVAQYLASAAYQEGDLPAAERYFRMILGWRPEDPEARNNLAWLLVTRPGAEQEDLREGLRLAEEASELRQAAYIWDTLAEAYARSAQPIKAEAAADMALRLAEQGHERGGESIDYYRTRWQTLSGREQGQESDRKKDGT